MCVMKKKSDLLVPEQGSNMRPAVSIGHTGLAHIWSQMLCCRTHQPYDTGIQGQCTWLVGEKGCCRLYRDGGNAR